MEAFLQASLPRLLPDCVTFEAHRFQGKHDLLRKLPARLSGYSRWLPPNWRIVVLVDRDAEDCRKLKGRIEAIFRRASLTSRSSRPEAGSWQVVSRLAIEELEAWYFGDWNAVRRCFPKASPTVPRGAKYRQPDGISGGTWEALERLLQQKGYFPSGLNKIEAARAIGGEIDWSENRSPSCRLFRDTLLEAVTG